MIAAPGNPVARTAPVSWSKACGVCRRAYVAAEWETLTIVSRLPPASVQSHLTVPAVWYVELRNCRCGTVLAARAP